MRSVLTLLTRGSVLVSACAASSPAQQSVSPSASVEPGPDVIVKGARERSPDTSAQVGMVADAHDGQLARFEVPACPLVIGSSRPVNAAIEARIRQVAAMAHVRVDRLGCKPNLTVVLANDGAAFVSALHRRRPTLFTSLSTAAARSLLHSPGPTWTWQSVSPKRRDGGPVEMISQIQFGNGPPQPVARGAYIASNVSLSRLTSPVRQDTDLAFVVFDARRLEGFTLQQIADHAALTGLAAVKTANLEALSRQSILTMFTDVARDRTAEPAATKFDILYLAGLYRDESGFSSAQKSAAIATFIDHGWDDTSR